ncbi:cysteine hydrolase family protein [Chitinolyticbacter albus]|uniref:cysteine hydrolase family protein n=1 Tax=Chitinolyticbacter albus TaxID=2961951 RepID=UPI00210911EE|nr:cysteine hydrolase family protein [Chitinolyticbacter albus]
MKTAVLVIDVQQALCTGKWSAFDIDAVVDRINSIAGQARTAGAPVFFIQHEENEGPFVFNTNGWQLYERLKVEPGDVRLRKTACDSFHRTELQSHLQSLGITDLIICGLQSEFCVDSTVRGALARGYPVVLVADGHSTLDNSVLPAATICAHHNATLKRLGSFGPRVSVTPATQVRIEV